MMPEDGLDQLRGFDAIYLDAVGYPRCPGPYFAVGFVDPHSARVSAVRQPAAGASAPRHRFTSQKLSARTNRYVHCPRKYRQPHRANLVRSDDVATPGATQGDQAPSSSERFAYGSLEAGPGGGCGDSKTGGRGTWVKSKSLTRSPRPGASSRTFGRGAEIGR